MADEITIGYQYSNGKHSDAAVKHAFRFLSTMTGLRFFENTENPTIFSGRGESPASSRIIIGSSDQIEIGDEHRIILQDDPIEKIIDLLSIRATNGPETLENDREKVDTAPVLSIVVATLHEALEKAGVIGSGHRPIELWPDGRSFCLAVTHDIDIARRSVTGGLRLLFQGEARGGIRGLADTFKSELTGAGNPYDQIDRWLQLERPLNLKSTFFVFAGKRHHRLDPKYTLSNLAKPLNWILENGSEIALHTSVRSSSGDFIDEARRSLEDQGISTISGLRPHYLSASLPEYCTRASKYGFSYSSCLGFDDTIGYYEGIDLPFMPYDKANDRPIEIVEFPIAMMDCGLIGKSEADSDEVLSAGKRMIDRAAEHGSLLVLDWHQRTLYDPDYPYWGKLFLDLVRYALDRNPFIDTLGNMASLINERSKRYI